MANFKPRIPKPILHPSKRHKHPQHHELKHNARKKIVIGIILLIIIIILSVFAIIIYYPYEDEHNVQNIESGTPETATTENNGLIQRDDKFIYNVENGLYSKCIENMDTFSKSMTEYRVQDNKIAYEMTSVYTDNQVILNDVFIVVNCTADFLLEQKINADIYIIAKDEKENKVFDINTIITEQPDIVLGKTNLVDWYDVHS